MAGQLAGHPSGSVTFRRNEKEEVSPPRALGACRPQRPHCCKAHMGEGVVQVGHRAILLALKGLMVLPAKHINSPGSLEIPLSF